MVKLLQINIFLIVSICFSQIEDTPLFTPEKAFNYRIPDSLSNKNYEFLISAYYNNIDFPEKASSYVKSCIHKAITNRDSLYTTKGYFYLSVLSKNSDELSYLDQAIKFSKSLKNETYPALLYYNRGSYYFGNAKYKKALDNFYACYNESRKNGNTSLAYDSKFQIGSLKSRIGRPKEALTIFKEHYDYVSKKEENYSERITSLFALSDSYTKLHKLDTASKINRKGIKISLLNNDKDMYYYFVMNEGVNLSYKKSYKKSVDSLEKSLIKLVELNDISNEIFARFYLGKSYWELTKKNKAIYQFKKIDSLYGDFKDLFPEIREGYKILIEYHKEKEDTDRQLFYLDRLIKVDSSLNSNYKYINNKIIKGFDTQNVIEKKELLINDLNKSNSFKFWGILFLLIILFLTLVYIVILNKTRKIDKIKFEQIITETDLKNNQKEVATENAKTSTILSEEIVKILEKGLSDFKEQKEFLKPDISINKLAKKIDSNSKYLSIYLNHYEQNKFTDFINDLRINYAIDKLKKDSKFRKYTIKAISETVGFSNPISFSHAFYKNTGLKPSYFIKQFENKLNN